MNTNLFKTHIYQLRRLAGHHRLVSTSHVSDSQTQASPKSEAERMQVERTPTATRNGTSREKESGNITSIPFAHAKLGNFFQERPQLENQFVQDTLMRSFLKRHVNPQFIPEIFSDLERFGERVTRDIYQLALRMEAEEPKLDQIDAWGRRVDNLITSTAWKAMKGIVAEEGLVALAYERNFGEWSRLYQMTKLFLFDASSGLYNCPLAMTNGAARTLELLKDDYPVQYDRAYARLTSRDPNKFWTSGQWMTEKQGGSDVAGGTETLAYEQPDGSYKLFGYKWFSSATDADMTLTLARIVDQDEQTVKGTKGLSLFYLELRDEEGEMNNIQMMKLKNKLGTRQLPTAELLIDGAKAYRVSPEGRGVASMANMLTVTRISTASASTSAMRRIVNLARDYATRRSAFGNTLHRYPLHIHTLANMEVETRAATIFVLELARLQGRLEVPPPGEDLERERELFRLVVPLAKLYTSKQAVAVISEGLECFGGQGYIEDTGLPGILRDVQVSAIWEGTTNILSLDVLRAIKKSSGSVLGHFRSSVHFAISGARENPALAQSASKVEKALEDVLRTAAQMPDADIVMAAREFAYSLARIYMAALLLEHAVHKDAKPADVYTANRWCERDLSLLTTCDQNTMYSQDAKEQNFNIVFDGYLHPSRL